jgi:transcription initiation factor TFIIB
VTVVKQAPVSIKSICSSCKRSDKIITDPDSGEIICSTCGVVILDNTQDIIHSDRPVSGTEEVNNRRRTGSPTSLHRYDRGLYTVIGNTDKDSQGHKIQAITSSNMVRLRVWDTRTQYDTYADRNLALAFNELTKLKDKLGLSYSAVETTAYIYRKAHARRLIKRGSITPFIAAAVYASCRKMGIPWTMKDIIAASNIKRKEIAHIYRILIRVLELKIPNADPIKCITKVANKANLTENTKRESIHIMDQVKEKRISAGKDPTGLAATVLYIACLKTGERRSKTELACAAGITEVTIRNQN